VDWGKGLGISPETLVAGDSALHGWLTTSGAECRVGAERWHEQVRYSARVDPHSPPQVPLPPGLVPLAPHRPR